MCVGGSRGGGEVDLIRVCVEGQGWVSFYSFFTNA